MSSRKIAAMDDIPGVPMRVADHLSDLIIRGELQPGERVPEARITRSLGVSRGSVRESLQILARRHLVELVPRRGALVTAITADEVENLFEMLVALYTSLALQAAQRWQRRTELEPLEHYVTEMQRCADQGAALELVDLTGRFTDAGCALVGNPYLTGSLQDLRAVFNRSYYHVLSSDARESHLLYLFARELMSSIVARDSTGLPRIVREYGHHLRDQVLQSF